MPKYLDHHKAVQLPPGVAEQMAAAARAGKTDENGVRPINSFYSKGGEAWCLVEAPNADVVHKIHEGLGITLAPGDVIEVDTLV